jgi:uncharacterized protein YdhG (YjbR/CyaY superfamily)
MKHNKSDFVNPGGVDEYISNCPHDVQEKLKKIRETIQDVAPDSTETVSYFDIPGYCYPGYDYHGMFAWFSFKKPHIRLHLRPPVIENHKGELAGYATTKAIVSFPMDQEIPLPLVKRLVEASIKQMKETSE